MLSLNHLRTFDSELTSSFMRRPGEYLPELTRMPRSLRWVRRGYACQPSAYRMYRRRRAACPQGPAYSTYWVRVPATGVPCVPRSLVITPGTCPRSRTRCARSSLSPNF